MNWCDLDKKQTILQLVRPCTDCLSESSISVCLRSPVHCVRVTVRKRVTLCGLFQAPNQQPAMAQTSLCHLCWSCDFLALCS